MSNMSRSKRTREESKGGNGGVVSGVGAIVGGPGREDYDLEPSDIEMEIEDENLAYFVEENFRVTESLVGLIPFKHWSLYR